MVKRRSRSGFFSQLSGKKIIMLSVIVAAAIIVALLGIFVWSVRTISGIDVSHYQGEISWKAMAQSSDIEFAYIKATEGATNQDPTFRQNWDGALQNGITPGAYHFFTDTSAASDQAANFIATVPKIKGTLPPAVDIEGTIAENENFKAELAVFIAAVTEHYGVKPILYVPYTIYNRIFDDYSDYDFWIIDDQTQPLVKGWTFRQYTTAGKIPGANEEVDLDEYQGSLWKFGQLKVK